MSYNNICGDFVSHHSLFCIELTDIIQTTNIPTMYTVKPSSTESVDEGITTSSFNKLSVVVSMTY